MPSPFLDLERDPDDVLPYSQSSTIVPDETIIPPDEVRDILSDPVKYLKSLPFFETYVEHESFESVDPVEKVTTTRGIVNIYGYCLPIEIQLYSPGVITRFVSGVMPNKHKNSTPDSLLRLWLHKPLN